jgi:hypothetical protein
MGEMHRRRRAPKRRHEGNILAASETAAQKIVDECGLLVGCEVGKKFAFQPS